MKIRKIIDDGAKKTVLITIEGSNTGFRSGGNRRGAGGCGALGQRIGPPLDLLDAVELLRKLFHLPAQKTLLSIQLVLVLHMAPIPLLQRLKPTKKKKFNSR